LICLAVALALLLAYLVFRKYRTKSQTLATPNLQALQEAENAAISAEAAVAGRVWVSPEEV
jgi:hypothetical protein